ncbi:MAG: stalk domain-containing protein [Peptostreptococcaceae bacterium]|nr:stalk domain-containing protein [Peptostreptococcaceae bacterium]
MRTKKLLSVILAFVMIMTMLGEATTVYAEGLQSLNVDGKEYDLHKDVLPKGLHWDVKKNMLTMENFSGHSIKANPRFGGNLIIRLIGENKLDGKVVNSEDVTPLYLDMVETAIEGDGELKLSTMNPEGLYVDRGLTIKDAKLKVNVDASKSNQRARGINLKGDSFSILGKAQVDIEVKSGSKGTSLGISGQVLVDTKEKVSISVEANKGIAYGIGGNSPILKNGTTEIRVKGEPASKSMELQPRLGNEFEIEGKWDSSYVKYELKNPKDKEYQIIYENTKNIEYRTEPDKKAAAGTKVKVFAQVKNSTIKIDSMLYQTKRLAPVKMEKVDDHWEFIMPNEDVKIQAIVKQLAQYLVQFESWDGTIAVEKVIEGQLLTKPADPKREGYEFLYWQKKGETKPYDFNELVMESFTLEQVWKSLAEPIKIEFEAGENGRLVGDLSYDGKKRQSLADMMVIIPLPFPDSGYKFEKWTPEIPDPHEKIIESKKFKASFIKEKTEYEIIIEDVQGAQVTTKPALKAEVQEQVAIKIDILDSSKQVKKVEVIAQDSQQEVPVMEQNKNWMFLMPNSDVKVRVVLEDIVPEVTKVTITPVVAEIAKGQEMEFKALVEGNNAPSQEVIWAVEGNTSPDTKISADGKLNVALEESATTLKVRATSVMDNSKTGEATVVITQNPIKPTFKITFEAGEGRGADVQMIATDGEELTLPQNVFEAPAGKTFKAWKIGNEEKKPNEKYLFVADTQVVALWKVVSSNSGGGSGSSGGGNAGNSRVRPDSANTRRETAINENNTPLAQNPNNKLTAILRIGSPILEKEIDGVKSQLTMDAVPFIQNGRTMVPLRYVAEILNLDVRWDNISKTVKLSDSNHEIKIPIQTTEIITNGKILQSDVKPVLKSGRTYLSVSNVAKALGLEQGKEILWNEETKEVTISRGLV